MLAITSSLFSDEGESTKLLDMFVDGCRAVNPELIVTRRDLSRSTIPHLDLPLFNAIMVPRDLHSEEQKEISALSDALIAEVKQADILVFGAPMYNYAMPSKLQSYIDHIARVNVTFDYTEDGPRGTLKDKKAIVISSRGGAFDRECDPILLPFSLVFKLLGIADWKAVCADGLKISPEARARGLASAEAQIEAIVAELHGDLVQHANIEDRIAKVQ